MASMETRNWELCFICQSDTAQPLTELASSVKLHAQPHKIEACYTKLIQNICDLSEYGDLPRFVIVEDLLSGSGDGVDTSSRIVQLMKMNKVVWHKNCRSAVNQQKVDRAKRKSEVSVQCQSPIKTKQQSSFRENEPGPSTENNDSLGIKCFFCEKAGDEKDLRKASTLGLDEKGHDAARRAGDVRLQAKLSKGDMIVLEAVYHLTCLTSLYRKADAADHSSIQTYTAKLMKAQAIQELIDYIKDHRTSSMVFNMAHLKALFDKRLASLGYPQSQYHITTPLRNDIISLIPDIKAIRKPSASWDLVFDQDLSQTLQEMKDTTSSDMRTLAYAVKILRRDMLDKGIFLDLSPQPQKRIPLCLS